MVWCTRLPCNPLGTSQEEKANLPVFIHDHTVMVPTVGEPEVAS